jgi:hypothetical protein
MRAIAAVATAVLLLLSSIGSVKAADPTLLAETGGYLLGNANRCGVPSERIKRAGKVIHDLIEAIAYNSGEAAAADSRFVEIFSASAYPSQDRHSFPSCKVVIAQFERLEQHHQQEGMD